MQTILVTGANRGIGLELVRRYAAAGERVFACCREPDSAAALQALAKAHPNVTVAGVRVADAASVDALAKQIGAAPIDVVINTAGVLIYGETRLVSLEARPPATAPAGRLRRGPVPPARRAPAAIQRFRVSYAADFTPF